jgi:hypothetical protein
MRSGAQRPVAPVPQNPGPGGSGRAEELPRAERVGEPAQMSHFRGLRKKPTRGPRRLRRDAADEGPDIGVRDFPSTQQAAISGLDVSARRERRAGSRNWES